MSHAPEKPSVLSVGATPEQQAQPARCALAAGSGFPQLRDNMATRTRELWRNESTLDYSLTEIATHAVPAHWNVEWRILWAMPFGTYENPFTLTSPNAQSEPHP